MNRTGLRPLVRSLGLAVLLAVPGAAVRAESPAAPAAAPQPAEPSDADLSGRDIYERVLRNRFQTYLQESTLISGDRAGNEQSTGLRLWFRSRVENGVVPESGVRSETMIKYTRPFDLRHTGYLVINHDQRPSDQFVYLPEYRRTRRINLRGEAVFGTDFSFEDILPSEIDDATYRRLPDGDLDGRPVFVVEAVPTAEANSEYSRFEVQIEKARSVPLRTRYWDDKGIEVKGLDVDVDSIEQIEQVWVPMHATMRNFSLESYTTLSVEKLEANPKLGRGHFSQRRLEGH